MRRQRFRWNAQQEHIREQPKITPRCTTVFARFWKRDQPLQQTQPDEMPLPACMRYTFVHRCLGTSDRGVVENSRVDVRQEATEAHM